MMVALGIMREQFMRCDIKKILSTSALALVLSLGYVNLCSAQGVVSLSNDAKANNSADEIPNEISLFGDDSSTVKVITPAKSTSGVKSAAELLGNKAAKDAKAAPANANGVKSAAELLGGKQNGVKSAAELLGNKAAPKTKEAPANANGVKSAAELLGGKPNGVKSAAELLNANKAQTEEKPNQAADQSQVISAKAIQTQTLGNVQMVKDAEESVFDQMSDLEKQTAILNLELKKEKVKSDIESLKAVQAKARQEEQARQEEEKRKVQEWKNAEKRKILQEQQKLKELEIALEKQRQESLLNSYKNQMLIAKQDAIKTQAELYKEISSLRDEKQALISDFKGRFVQLTRLADKATNDAIRVRDNYAKTISDLQTQISILKARLEANKEQNPFADGKTGDGAPEVNDVRISDLYAVMEIRGQGNNMIAKLINENGYPFMVKVGTALQSGHIIDEITPTYVRGDKGGYKDYLYFSAGGILDKEPIHNEDISVKAVTDNANKTAVPAAVMSNGIPGVAAEMTIR